MQSFVVLNKASTYHVNTKKKQWVQMFLNFCPKSFIPNSKNYAGSRLSVYCFNFNCLQHPTDTHTSYLTLPSSCGTHKKSHNTWLHLSQARYFTSQQWHSFQLLPAIEGMVLSVCSSGVKGLPSTKQKPKWKQQWRKWMDESSSQAGSAGRPRRCGFLCCDANKFLSDSWSWQSGSLCSQIPRWIATMRV